MIILYILGGLVAIGFYVIGAAVVHGLYVRHSLLKYGGTWEQRMKAEATLKNGEWDKAYWAKDWAWTVAALWPLTPFLYCIRFVFLMLKIMVKFIMPPLARLHKSVIYAGLNKTGASSKDSEKGVYRS